MEKLPFTSKTRRRLIQGKHASSSSFYGEVEQVLADEGPHFVPGVHRRRGLRQAAQTPGARVLPVLLLPLEDRRREAPSLNSNLRCVLVIQTKTAEMDIC